VTRYAEGTSVPVAKSKMEIELLLQKHRATRTAMAQEAGRAVVYFELQDRRVQFSMPLPLMDEKRFVFGQGGHSWKKRTPEAQAKAWEQACRERWRALLLAIKAKFVSVETGVETFEQAFLAHIVLPGGMTVGQRVLPAVAESYRTGTLPPLLPSGAPS